MPHRVSQGSVIRWFNQSRRLRNAPRRELPGRAHFQRVFTPDSHAAEGIAPARVEGVLEDLWMTAHRAAWFPSWWCFQLVAVAVGAVIVRRRAFFVGAATAAVGAVVVANGADWAHWIANGCHGHAPELEVAGFGALAGLIGGFFLASGGSAAAARALSLAIGPMLFIARLGCFFAGCDFGAPATLPWALRYPHWTPAFAAQLDAKRVDLSSAMTQPVHPTQLYESALGIVIFFVARRRPSLSLAVAMYAVGRFAIDFFRGDQGHGALGLTTSQLLALAALGLVISRTAQRSASLPRECAAPSS
jgi:hypothetical protein